MPVFGGVRALRLRSGDIRGLVLLTLGGVTLLERFDRSGNRAERDLEPAREVLGSRRCAVRPEVGLEGLRAVLRVERGGERVAVGGAEKRLDELDDLGEVFAVARAEMAIEAVDVRCDRE